MHQLHAIGKDNAEGPRCVSIFLQTLAAQDESEWFAFDETHDRVDVDHAQIPQVQGSQLSNWAFVNVLSLQSPYHLYVSYFLIL